MFLKRLERRKNGKGHTCWALVESIRTAGGSRHRVVAHLGELKKSKRHGWATLWRRLKRAERPLPSLFDPPPFDEPADDDDPARVKLKDIRLERLRDFGDVWLALGLWRLLKLDVLLSARRETGAEGVPWSVAAAILTIARFTDRFVSASAGVAREEALRVEELHPPERLYVGMDGVMYPTRYREDHAERPGEKKIVYQEMKTACVFWQDRDGKWIKRVISGREDSERFGLSVWALAVRCGMLQAQEVIFISDGGAWCNTVAELYFADAARILDFFHLSERVWQTAHAMYPTDEASVQAWASNCVGILKASSGMRLLAHLEKSRAVRAAQKDADLTPLDGLIGYVKPRLHMTDYIEYAEAGYVIGSGVVEATCKQLVGVRLKGHGRQWSECGAVSMAAMIGQRLNGTWDRFWNTRPRLVAPRTSDAGFSFRTCCLFRLDATHSFQRSESWTSVARQPSQEHLAVMLGTAVATFGWP